MNYADAFRHAVRPFLPTILLKPYRVIRSISRVILFNRSNKRGTKHFEKLILERFPALQTSNNSGVVLDIGANVGHFSAACRSLGFDVVAVEPHPAALRHLKKRFRHDSKVTILEKAVSDHAQLVTLHMHPQHVFDPISTSIAASIFPDKFITETLQVEVESLTMTMLFEKHSSFEIVKIDIEGAEMLLVDDIINNHARINKLLMETHERFMRSTTESFFYMSKLGELNNFIVSNSLQDKWLTDWV